MRLIDADALRDRLQNLAYSDWNQGATTSWADAYNECADMVEDIPSTDAVEVVRCKDCLIHGLCRFEQGLGLDGFCSQGERKDD